MPEPVLIPLTHADGSRTSIRHFVTTTEQPSVFVIFPAMGVMSSYYNALGNELAERGFNTFTVDLRGNGESSIRPSRKVDFGYKDELDHEFSNALAYVKNRFPDKRIIVWGHSLGGQLACLFAARKPHVIDHLVLVACCSVYWKGYSGINPIKTLLGTQYLRAIVEILGYLPGQKVGFGGLEAKTVIRDWSHQGRTGNYVLRNDAFDYEAGLRKVTTPALAVSIEGDALAPPSAVDHLIFKLENAQRKHVHLKRDDEYNDGYNHFNWARKPKRMVDLVLKELNTN